MRFLELFLIAALLSAPECLAQNAPLRDTNIVSVQELTLPHKAARAFDKGTALLLKGDPAASLAYFREAIEQAPSFYRPYHNLALALYRLGQFDAATENFQKSIDLTNGSFAPSLFGLSMILYQRSDYAHAELLIRNGLLALPGSAVGEYCLALVQYSLGRFDDSERSVRDSLLRDPNQADAYVLLARLHERQRNAYAVLADIESYFKLDPHGALHDQALQLSQRAQLALPSQSASLR